ncbi:MAG TPA: hypothetical protein VGR27_15470 [Longimicrobiaceae bacterium]|nr:hypothetical protein [Longimicrobiaceae bacterium]
MFLLFSMRSILDPFLLFVLLVLHVSPYAGTGSHLLVVTASALIPLAVLMKLLLRMALSRYESGAPRAPVRFTKNGITVA